MVDGPYRDLFVAIAGAAGALTGLLFVALSVAPGWTAPHLPVNGVHSNEDPDDEMTP